MFWWILFLSAPWICTNAKDRGTNSGSHFPVERAISVYIAGSSPSNWLVWCSFRTFDHFGTIGVVVGNEIDELRGPIRQRQAWI
jgi:hypothetical protein